MAPRFTRFAAAGALAVAVYVLWAGLQLGGGRATAAVLDVSQLLAGVFAAISCVLAARRASGHYRTAWWLLGASALSWSLGEVVWTANEVGRGVAQFPSPADAGFLLAVPLQIAGILFLSADPSAATNRARAVIEGALFASALVFCLGTLGLDALFVNSRIDQASRYLAVAYPVSDVVVLTVLITAFRQTIAGIRPVFLLLLGAFGITLVSDSAFAYMELGSLYGSVGSVLDVGWVAGFILLGLAALWHVRPGEASGARQVRIWQLGLPWIAMLMVIATVAYTGATGRVSAKGLMWFALAFGGLFVISQILALNDFLGLLIRSRRAEAELSEQKALLNEVIDRAPLGIARISAEFHFLAVNPRLCEMLGSPAQALVGSTMRAFLSDEEMARAQERMMRMRTGELAQVDVDGEMRTADGRTLWVHRSVTPLVGSGGRVDHYLVMFDDITEEHNADEVALANLAALENLSRLKSEFMSMVSHEFRTALTGIQGYSELMSSQDVSTDEVREFAGDINSDALRLNRMITEMLDLDRIESGRMALHMASTDLNQILSDTVDRARMSTSRHEIVAHLDPRLPRIEGDSDRLTQVVANLLTNAVKYAPDGGEILVSSRTQNGSVEVSVQDHGLGIPPEFVGRIFGRYERYEGDGKKQVVGTGLGLAIAHQIIQLHKGRIWVESTLGNGSTFRFTIPAAAQPVS